MEREREDVNWIHLTQDTLVAGFPEHCNGIPGSTNSGELTSWVTTSFKEGLLHGIIRLVSNDNI